MTDDLVRSTTGPGTASADRPWRPTSIVYPAFFGGPLAATLLGLLNCRRLGLGRAALLNIAAAGVLGIAIRFWLTSAWHELGLAPILGIVTGVAVWAAVMAVQRRPFQARQLRHDEAASLMWPGIAAAVGCGVLEAVLLGLLVGG